MVFFVLENSLRFYRACPLSRLFVCNERFSNPFLAPSEWSLDLVRGLVFAQLAANFAGVRGPGVRQAGSSARGARHHLQGGGMCCLSTVHALILMPQLFLAFP